MKRSCVIDQLKELVLDRKSFLGGGYDDTYRKDIVALNVAIRELKKEEVTRRVIRQICEFYGQEPQFIVAIEELSELIKAITKAMRGGDTEKLREDIITEIADVKIIAEELTMIIGAEKEVDEEVKNKLVRQICRIHKEEKECRMNA